MFYHYIISSLPALSFGEKSSMTSELFLEVCRTWISGKPMKEIETLSLYPESDSKMKLVKDYIQWESYLRNNIVKARALKYNFENAEIRSQGKLFMPDLDRGVNEAFSAENPKEKERLLDILRWKWLDAQDTRYIFKLENLCIYKYRLLINEKWTGRISENGRRNVDSILGTLYKSEAAEATSVV